MKKDKKVNIRVYNATGKLVRELKLGHKPSGIYVSQDSAAYWDGKGESGESVVGGIYFYTIQTGDFKTTRKMTIVR